MTACRPDVLMTSDDATVRLIAIFTDGFEFHVHPGKTTSRLADDAVKRRAPGQSRHGLAIDLSRALRSTRP
jgi:DEAD/DEAH box helicase domain-containing protein